MQAIRDAGIVVVVILLAVSVRFTPLDENGQDTGLGSLTPQAEAAPFPLPADHAATAHAAAQNRLATPDEFSIQWVVNDGDEIMFPANLKEAAIEHCSEILIHIHKAAEETHNEAIVFGTEEIVKVLPCSA